MAHTICLIPGDGIGPEVTRAAQAVLEAAGVAIDWLTLPAGATAAEEYGDVLPAKTIEAIEHYRLALKGPVTTPVGKGFSSVNVQLRKRFALYAAVRPVRSMPGIKTRFENVEIVVIRENTEGLYSGIENEIVPGVVQSLKIATRPACERIARFAFKYARERERRKVTVFHKANIMKKSDGLFLECAQQAHAEMGQGITFQQLIIDNGCMQLVRDPTQFDVLLLENLYGDMISDLCAGLVGGLGVVPGANIGDDCAIFEAVHGSAPDIAGRGLANPLALIMSSVMMLNYIHELEAAERIKAAYNEILLEHNPENLTADIGGTGGTEDFVRAVIARL
ncbi:MAG TPA: isocitrate/isopropylmalate dehydrogenase family protein [Candidatus Sumerlaeota bacterium]|nr:MAG: Homoisocitrate dehydrogenase [candidate division BRC1 bacterium ADurb.BinA292]HPK02223.1 isocitrate/isopropylmalate dehydrogenase family protein [Candidatus Sumerlaeota bacterium]